MIEYFSFTFFIFLLLQRNFFPLRLRHHTSATKLHYLPSSAFYRALILCKCFSRTCHKSMFSSVPAFSFIYELNGGFEHDVANSLWSPT